MCPQQRYATGPVVTEPAGSVFEKKSFYREIWVQDDGGRHVAKRSSHPRVAYPEIKVQVRDLVRVVDIVAPFAPRGVGTRGKFVLSSPSG